MTLPYAEWIENAASAYRDLLDAGPLSAQVPSCPGWTLVELTVHLGGVHRWAAAQIRGQESREWRHPQDDFHPGDDLGHWFIRGADDLLDALSSSDYNTPCSTLYPPEIVGTWARRQALETSVHYWDAQGALGMTGAIDASLAQDGVLEVVNDLLPRQVRLGRVEQLPVAIELRIRETELTPARPLLLGGAQQDVAAVVEGDAEDLLLILWRRRSLEDSRVTIEGSERAVRTVLSAAIVP